MSTKLEELEGLERRLTLELSAAELEERVEDRLERLRRTAEISGFRPGKVPRKYLQRRFGGQVRREQAEALAQSELRKALAETGVWPVSAPALEVKDLEAAPRAIVTFEVFPALPELDLARLELELPHVSLEEGDVQEMRDRLELPADDAADLRKVMERELEEALKDERLSVVEGALLESYPDLDIPAALLDSQRQRLAEVAAQVPEDDAEAFQEEARDALVVTFLFAEIARQRGLRPDPTRLWRRTQELAEASDEPAAELDEIWSDGELIQELEEELLRQDVAEAVLAEARVREIPMTFRELARHRRIRAQDEMEQEGSEL